MRKEISRFLIHIYANAQPRILKSGLVLTNFKNSSAVCQNLSNWAGWNDGDDAYKICICIFSKVPFAPEVDLLFAVSATTRNASETLRTMKDTLIYIINTYGVGNIRYVFVSFLCSTYEDMRHRPFTRFSWFSWRHSKPKLWWSCWH